MQNRKEVRENSRTAGRQFDRFGSFGSHVSIFPSIFGGNDIFDDPFFSRHHGGLFNTETGFGNPRDVQPMSKSKGPVIVELDSDDEGAAEDEANEVGSGAWTNRNPLVQHPEDQGNDHGTNTTKVRDVSSITNQNKVEAPKAVSRSVSFQKVTYGGVNGTYYTSTTTRRTGSDGVMWEESKQADRTTGQAAHKVSRGIHDKGHSVMRKLGSDGKVETMQTLQNLHEDEIEGFEKSWGGIADSHGFHDFHKIFGRSSSSNRLGPLAAWGGFPDSFGAVPRTNRSKSFNPTQSGSGRPKKVVTINID